MDTKPPTTTQRLGVLERRVNELGLQVGTVTSAIDQLQSETNRQSVGQFMLILSVACVIGVMIAQGYTVRRLSRA